MKFLAFSNASVRIGTRRVRAARFDTRSSLPTSAACLVANGFRETLSALLGAPVQVRLFEPAVPGRQAWAAIAASARLYRVRGTLCDAAIVLRPGDDTALAAAAFGESAAGRRNLSGLESRVLDRVIGALASQLTGVCGLRAGEAVAYELVEHLDGFVTYFEVDVTAPVAARIGVALSRDPLPPKAGAMDMSALAAVPIDLRVVAPCATMAAGELASMRPGDIVPLAMTALAAATLMLGGTALATGELGVANGQYALAVGHMTAQENH